MKGPVWHSEKKELARDDFIQFASGRDVEALPPADEVLIPYDVWTNLAHAKGLYKIGVLTKAELRAIFDAFVKLEHDWQTGEWKFNPLLEDVHMNIESFITVQCGEEIGGKLHTGRSRNDQVATDMKLLTRDIALGFAEEIRQLVLVIIKHAEDHLQSVMPGYTHHRKATISTWAHYCASYAQSLLRDFERLIYLAMRINRSPLGAAAAYGTTWSIDRRYTAKLLGFDTVQENTLDAVLTRGEPETEAAQALCLYMKHLSTLSQDLIVFSAEEFGYLELPGEFTTGSSIMPQKRNPDFAEAIKGKAQLINGYTQSLMGMNSANLSGYNKDIQWSKYVFVDLVREAQYCGVILQGVFEKLIVNTEAMRRATDTGFLNAVDIADHLARSRELPFRETYRVLSDIVAVSQGCAFDYNVINGVLIKHEIETLSEEEYHSLSDPLQCIQNRNHEGSPHPQHTRTNLENLQKAVSVLQKRMDTLKSKIEEAQNQCRNLEEESS